MTHLNVPIGQITNLVTMQLPKDNHAQPFYFDRNAAAPFTTPAGFSFVITDVIVNPEVTNFAAGQFYLVVVTVDGARSLAIRCDGRSAHLALVGGLAVPDQNGPPPGGGVTARNTTFSSGPVEVQLLGYFVKVDAATAVGKPFAP